MKDAQHVVIFMLCLLNVCIIAVKIEFYFETLILDLKQKLCSL